ncbi:MAG: DUF4199 domain-containing protein [Gracilimonas sp.]|uniref:DUF4199 domain-containing protein n=1 Tax=Gracilimonas sp. TaxID=1974203 RepID=UPI0019C81552|nr:DUF4199 domain-containing protein [Gracilimonas sp.]MBD3616214.1 DUF4199 domain-containing protein [Gracilimonas sp.]
MKRNVLIFGSIIGVILIFHIIYMVHLMYSKPDFQSNDVLGYIFLFGVFSLVFFGVRNYRNKELDGFISLGKAFKTGALIALLAATFYVVFWLFYYYLYVPDFLDKYIEHVMLEAALEGATEAELAAQSEQMDQFKSWYQSPFMVVFITYMEVLPIGLVVAFISSLVLKKKPETDHK